MIIMRKKVLSQVGCDILNDTYNLFRVVLMSLNINSLLEERRKRADKYANLY